MLRWCAYCQSFLGEAAPFETLEVTHGICTGCKAKGLIELSDSTGRHWKWVESAAKFSADLWAAGATGNYSMIPSLVSRSQELGIRPLDVMTGFIAPALRQVGALWERGQFSVAEEHRFTALCQQIISILRNEALERISPSDAMRKVLLLNADGNYHTLGLQMAELWFLGNGFATQAITPGLPAEEVVRLVRKEKPLLLGLSVSLPTQEQKVRSVIKSVTALSDPPKVLLGGYAVKAGLLDLSDCPACRVFTDFTDLRSLLNEWRLLKPA